MVILALDVGQKRIGVAVSDELHVLATPREVIVRRSTAAALARIVLLVREVRAELVVMGLPVSFDGQAHTQAHAVQAFAARLRARLPVPVVFADETLSTVQAEEMLRAAGARPERIRQRIDAVAAAIILQDCLDARVRAAGGLAGRAPAPFSREATDA